MADTAVHSLTEKTTLAATDEFYLVQSPYGAGDDRRVSLANVNAYLNGTAQTWTKQNTFAAGTITTSQPFTITQTWNASGVTFNAFQVNATSTASAAASNLLDLQLAGVSALSVRKTGLLTFPTAFGTSPAAAGANGICAGADVFEIAFYGNNTGMVCMRYDAGLKVNQNRAIGFVNNDNATNGTMDVKITRGGAATLQYGDLDAATAVAQIVRVQSVVAGTADTAGANWTMRGSLSTGTGIPGDIIFQVAGKGAASTVQNTAITALTIKGGTTNNTNVGYPSVVIGNAALGTTATDGFLYIPTCAGTPTGVPTGFTGRVPLVYDSTNKQFWIYDGAWLQPKTPAGAAIVTWQ